MKKETQADSSFVYTEVDQLTAHGRVEGRLVEMQDTSDLVWFGENTYSWHLGYTKAGNPTISYGRKIYLRSALYS